MDVCIFFFFVPTFVVPTLYVYVRMSVEEGRDIKKRSKLYYVSFKYKRVYVVRDNISVFVTTSTITTTVWSRNRKGTPLKGYIYYS